MNAETVRSAAFWEGSDIAVHFRTSGSTGEPKWIVLSKDALLISARAVNEWLEVDAVSVWGLALPMDHVGGFGVAARAYVAGCGFSQYQGKWDARKCAEWLRENSVTHLSLVPTQLHDLLEAGMEAVPSLRAVVVGGGRLPDEMGHAARDAGWPVLASYGMTEACSQVATQPMSALGKAFADAPLQLLPIWDAELSGNGQLRLRGDALFSGTIIDGAFLQREDDWFLTSDRAELSGRMIKPLGRADTMVKIMGELVDVEAVENRFIELSNGRVSHGGFVLIAIPDERREHGLLAIFEGKAIPECVDEFNWQAPGPERIGGYVAVAGFPRTALGKILRGELRAMTGY